MPPATSNNVPGSGTVETEPANNDEGTRNKLKQKAIFVDLGDSKIDSKYGGSPALRAT